MALPDLLRGVRRIVCLGDSITEQGDQPGGYVSLIREALSRESQGLLEVVGAGISGHRSNDMRQRFDRDVLRHRPDMVTISCGINDVWHGFDAFHPDGGGPRSIPLAAFRKNVQAMVESAQADRIMPVLLSTTVNQEDPNSTANLLLRDYNSVLGHVAEVTGCLFIDLFHPFLQEIARSRKEEGNYGLWLTEDGVHLNERGNALMARLVLEGLGVSV